MICEHVLDTNLCVLLAILRHILEMDHWPIKCIFFGLNGKHKSVWKYPFKTLKILNISPYQLLLWDTEVWKELELE